MLASCYQMSLLQLLLRWPPARDDYRVSHLDPCGVVGRLQGCLPKGAAVRRSVILLDHSANQLSVAKLQLCEDAESFALHGLAPQIEGLLRGRPALRPLRMLLNVSTRPTTGFGLSPHNCRHVLPPEDRLVFGPLPCRNESRGIWQNTARVLPEFERDRHGIDVDTGPPCCFVAFMMKLAVVDSAKRDRELIRYLAAQCTFLSKSDVVRVRRLSTTR